MSKRIGIARPMRQMLVRCVLLALVAVVAWVTAGCAPRDDKPVQPGVVFAGYPPGPKLGCAYSRAALSPDGSMFTLVQSGDYRPGEDWPIYLGDVSPSRSAVIDAACFTEKGSLQACQVGTIQAGPVADGNRAWWSTDSRHVFVDAGGRVGAFSVDREAKTIRLVDEPREHRFLNSWTLAIVGPTPSTSRTDEWARIRAAEDWFAKVRSPFFRSSPLSAMRVTLGPEGMVASGTLTGSIGLGVVRPSDAMAVEDTGYMVSAFQGEDRPMLLRDERGGEWLVGMGEALHKRADGPRDGRRWESGPRAGLFGKRPILDASSGRFLGVHTERDIDWAHPDEELVGLRERILEGLQPASRLHQIEVSRHGGAAVVLSHQRASVSHAVYTKAGPDREWGMRSAECRRDTKSAKATMSAAESPTVTTYDAGEPGWPLIASLTKTSGAARLVVYLHGGPGSSVLHGEVGDPHGWVDRRSADVVSYDPSGTIGVDASVAERLARFGGDALQRDADLIVSDVVRLAAGYDEVVLYAASFGGALVPAVSAGLGPLLKRAFLAAPLAVHHHPASNERERRHNRKSNYTERFSELFHDLHFGNRRTDDRQPFDQWLLSQYRRMTLDERFVVVQGSLDDLSRPGDIPNPGKAKMVVVDGGHHATAWHPETICWLADECGSPAWLAAEATRKKERDEMARLLR